MNKVTDADIHHHLTHGLYVDANAVGSFMDETPYMVVFENDRRGWMIRDVVAELQRLVPSLKGSDRETAEENLRFLKGKMGQ